MGESSLGVEGVLEGATFRGGEKQGDIENAFNQFKRPPLSSLTTRAFWYALASSRAQIAVQFGMTTQREPSPVSGTVARPPLVVVEL